MICLLFWLLLQSRPDQNSRCMHTWLRGKILPHCDAVLWALLWFVLLVLLISIMVASWARWAAWSQHGTLAHFEAVHEMLVRTYGAFNAWAESVYVLRKLWPAEQGLSTHVRERLEGQVGLGMKTFNGWRSVYAQCTCMPLMYDNDTCQRVLGIASIATEWLRESGAAGRAVCMLRL